MITEWGQARTQSITTKAGSWAAWPGFQTHPHLRADLCCSTAGSGLQVWGGRGRSRAAPWAGQHLYCLPAPGRGLTNIMSFLSWLPWLTNRQGKKRHSFIAKAGRLCSDGQDGCFLYPDTINAFLVTWKTALPLLWPQISHHSRVRCCRQQVPLLPFHPGCEWAVNPAGTTPGAGQQPAQTTA